MGSFQTFRALGGSESVGVKPIGPIGPSPFEFVPKTPFPFDQSPGKMKVIDMNSVNQSLQSFGISTPVTHPKTQQKPVEDCPAYFERNSSFLTKKSPRETFESVLHRLRKRNIDHSYQSEIHKIKGDY